MDRLQFLIAMLRYTQHIDLDKDIMPWLQVTLAMCHSFIPYSPHHAVEVR